MTIPALPPVAPDVPSWVRKAATTIGLLIGKAAGFDTSIASNAAAIAVLQAPSTIKFTPLASAPASPAAGWVYYDSTLNKHRGYDGTAWNNLY